MPTKNHITGSAVYRLPFTLFRKKDFSDQIKIPLETLEMTHRQLLAKGQAEKLVRTHNRKKKDGIGIRKVHDPEPSLKSINRGIDKMLKQVPLPPCFRGGVKKGTIMANATPHIGNQFMEVMDISDFFPSIGARRIREMLVKIGCSSSMARFITPFVTYRGIDPQGFPTAGTIANIYLANYCYPQILEIMGEEIVQSYWVDDIAFSDVQRIPHEKIQKVVGVLKSAGLKIHSRKTKSLGMNSRKRLTGTEISKTRIKPNTSKVSSLEADLHLLKKQDPAHIALTKHSKSEQRKKSKLSPEKWLIEHIRGVLCHVRGINEKSFQKIVTRYAGVIEKYGVLLSKK